MNKAAFLDRDGVINRKAREGDYITRWDDVEILPGVAEAIANLNRADFQVIVATNQRCVAKGLITISELEALHWKIRRVLQDAGALIDAVYCCPHDNEPRCRCRKPAPGMLLDAARDHEIDLNTSWMIGDSQADIVAGRAAGCKTALVGEPGADVSNGPDVMATSLLDAVHQILQPEMLRGLGNQHLKPRVRV